MFAHSLTYLLAALSCVLTDRQLTDHQNGLNLSLSVVVLTLKMPEGRDSISAIDLGEQKKCLTLT